MSLEIVKVENSQCAYIKGTQEEFDKFKENTPYSSLMQRELILVKGEPAESVLMFSSYKIDEVQSAIDSLN